MALRTILTAALLDVATSTALLVFAIVSFAPFAFFVRGAVSDRRPSPA